MTLPPDFYTSPAEREQLRVELALIVAAHPSGALEVGSDVGAPAGMANMYRVSCGGPACDWSVVVSSLHVATMHPAHVARELEPTILAFADTIRLRQESKPAAAT